MTATGTKVEHPARYSPQILDVVAPILIEFGLPVHDPFAGTGERLGRLCDVHNLTFTGTEIEPEFIVDKRVRHGDSTDAASYPSGGFVVFTSPVYPNGMADHFAAKDGSRRHTYRQALAANLGHDRPLHDNNMGRYGNRFRRSAACEQKHFDLARRCVRHWPDRAVVNVKDVVAASYRVPVGDLWRSLLERFGYRVEVSEVATPGQRHGANGGLRAAGELVLVCERVRRPVDDDQLGLFDETGSV